MFVTFPALLIYTNLYLDWKYWAMHINSQPIMSPTTKFASSTFIGAHCCSTQPTH
uniref:Uncharacterized protein n=1 Tax=Rhizophora mucronata TaxID=61149 RepID=A0A2P2MXQ9_RHIMU